MSSNDNLLSGSTRIKVDCLIEIEAVLLEKDSTFDYDELDGFMLIDFDYFGDGEREDLYEEQLIQMGSGYADNSEFKIKKSVWAINCKLIREVDNLDKKMSGVECEIDAVGLKETLEPHHKEISRLLNIERHEKKTDRFSIITAWRYEYYHSPYTFMLDDGGDYDISLLGRVNMNKLLDAIDE